VKLFAFVLAALILAFLGCEDEPTCKVDTDCPQGTICREARCGPVSPDASTSTIDSAAPPPSTDDAGTTQPPPENCRQLYELCQNDCCLGLSCINGACR
jgi:hypothetical protein